ncbi:MULTISPECIES: 5-oxoprolinase subunit PxpA [unclassified Lentimonas]|uniref:5-oxoprolinase subunit PxpA n=1 Tax=unclassified Lentimonas TaxID=2630993 RepID=UPI00132061BE|nr:MULTISPECIES: 5-oxoprolinase subunit PxpA [unclassified Lentimonas]CAA6679820.1 Lactam utilization protein LamB [Lentimonas sp. CC4]CAA6685668.1 Lactam utilization protein LamB [Lentimonas sp. CC6]CAA7077112.1 Lactam utilization protein LamB [Lentimonas sp. CC4]CAA7168806.1 Lactam utilization protein LamB [Lentimonas sp. CC21]CAA7180828.1 Lactam utilization protein LamB [Lentimonas sp. CC8]
MGELLLNCDLGENESAAQTECLMARVGAANICCGVHAGSLEKTRATLELAKRFGVLVGAHPGLAVAGGRGGAVPSVAELDALLQEQLGSFVALAGEVDVPVSYVKLHGTLYHAVEQNDRLAEAYLRRIKLMDTNVGIFSLAGGRLSRVARADGIRVWEEAFADRGYTESGQLVPRDQPGALIDGVSAAVERLRQWQQTGAMPTVDGGSVAFSAETLCVHSDSPDALELLEALRA